MIYENLMRENAFQTSTDQLFDMDSLKMHYRLGHSDVIAVHMIIDCATAAASRTVDLSRADLKKFLEVWRHREEMDPLLETFVLLTCQRITDLICNVFFVILFVRFKAWQSDPSERPEKLEHCKSCKHVGKCFRSVC